MKKNKEDLIKEVGLKQAYLSLFGASGGLPPKDLKKLESIIRRYSPSFDDKRIKEYAKEALSAYHKMCLSWHKIPQGLELYQYGLPPATKHLYDLLVEEKLQNKKGE